MFGNFTEEEIRILFLDLADEMENECGNWENLPETENDLNLKKQIIDKVNEMIEKDSNQKS